MRAIRTLLIVVVVLGGLFVAADRIAVYYAENKAADKIRSSQNLSGTPDVSIKGFPFLTQVADSKLDEVEVSLDGGVTADPGTGHSIRVSGFDATLRGVRMNTSFTSATADRASGSAHLSYEDLSKVNGPGITVGYGGKDSSGAGRVKVTGKVPLLGEKSVVSTVTVANGNTIKLHASEVPTQGLPSGLEQTLRGKIDFERQITGLPRGLKLDKAVVTEKGVDITLTGTDIKLAG